LAKGPKIISLADDYYGTLIGSHGCWIEWYHFWWLWVTLTRVSRSLYTYKSNISKTVRF